MFANTVERHREFTFAVPEGVSKLILRMSFDSPVLAQIPMTLFDPTGYRGTRIYPFVKGEIREQLWLAPDDASPGGIPGALPSGNWRTQLFARKLDQDVEFLLEVVAEFGLVPAPVVTDVQTNQIKNSEPGWYCGELHCHTTESTGEVPIATVIEAATQAKLDFLSLTDGLTVSQWYKARPFQNSQLAVLNGCELVGLYGHANAHGIHKWVDPFVDRPDWGMNQAADAVHAQGGLFCINHPLNARLGWRYHDFDWSKADMIEIYSVPERINNNIQAMLWDRQISLGYRVVGVGSTDSHNPFKPIWELGQVVTWVNAPNLSEQGILAGLRRGQVYVSRGPELRFSAEHVNGATAEMWESVPLDSKPVRFTLKVKTAEPLNVFIIKNGFIFDALSVDAGSNEWQTLTFEDTPTEDTYFRIEFHSHVFREGVNNAYMVWRDYETLRAFSNPIWVTSPNSSKRRSNANHPSA